jgi:hypothetical protein
VSYSRRKSVFELDPGIIVYIDPISAVGDIKKGGNVLDAQAKGGDHKTQTKRWQSTRRLRRPTRGPLDVKHAVRKRVPEGREVVGDGE